jgi:hypothetical protein
MSLNIKNHHTVKHGSEHHLKQDLFAKASAITDKYGYTVTGSATVSTGRGFRINMYISPKYMEKQASKFGISSKTYA